MCIQVVERYAMCRCMYHIHAIDPCGIVGRQGHRTLEKIVLVGYACPKHNIPFKDKNGSDLGIESIEAESVPSRRDDRLATIHYVEPSLIAVQAGRQTESAPLDSQPFLNEANHLRGGPQRLQIRNESENLRLSFKTHSDSGLKSSNDTTGSSQELNLEDEATNVKDDDWENITYWDPDPKQHGAVSEGRPEPHGKSDAIAVRPTNIGLSQTNQLNLELDADPTTAKPKPSAWNRFGMVFKHIVYSEQTALVLRLCMRLLFDCYFRNVEPLVYQLVISSPDNPMIDLFSKLFPEVWEVTELASLVSGYIFGRFIACRFPVVREALMLCQPWQSFVQFYVTDMRRRSSRCYHTLNSRGSAIWETAVARQSRLCIDRPVWLSDHLINTSGPIIAKTEDFCENLGNGLIAANYRSLGYATKSLSSSGKLKVWCRCGQKHTFASLTNAKGSGKSDIHIRAGQVSECLKCWVKEQNAYSSPRASANQGDRTAMPSTMSNSQQPNNNSAVANTTNAITAATLFPQPTAIASSRCNGMQRLSRLNPTPIVGTQTTGRFIPHDQRFLLLCVNVSRYGIALKHVNVHGAVNDLNLITAIRQGYNDARAGRRWSIFHSLDQPVRFNLTKFCLIPRRTDIRVGVLDFPSIPPLDEVKIHERYHYCTCIEPNGSPYLPMNTVFMDAFFDPVEHTTRWWIDHLPKKLKEPLVYDPDQGTLIGWGIHIVEGPNLLLFSLIVFITLFILVVLCVIWVLVLGGSVSDAFTLGSFILALVVAGCTFAYYYWQQRGVVGA